MTKGRSRVSASGTAAASGDSPGRAQPRPGGQVEHLLRQVTPGRYDAYEALLHALAESEIHLLLWHGEPGAPDAQYGNMDVEGVGYAPCVTSTGELAASGWTRAHEAAGGLDAARALYPEHYGLWLNPHAQGGGLGIPWPDLRRIAHGLDSQPPGPLRLSEPVIELPQFYALLTQNAHRTPAVRALRRAWVQPALGVPYLAIGLDVYDSAPPAVESVRAMMRQSIGVVPEGLPVSTVALADPHDPVAMWLRARARPFYDREAHATPAAPPSGYGYPPPYGARPAGY